MKSTRSCFELQITTFVELMTTSPSFVLEYSLFRVAKTLRLMGYDTVCDSQLRGMDVIRLGQVEKRIVVTGSAKLHSRLSSLVSRSNQPRTRQIVGYNSDGESEYDSGDSASSTPVQYIKVDPSKSHLDTAVVILQALNLRWDEDKVFSRCVVCNCTIGAVPKEEIRSQVAANVFDLYEQFYICRGCKKVYWGVDHNRNVLNYKAFRTLEYLRRSVAALLDGSGGPPRLHVHILSLPLKLKSRVMSFLDSASHLALNVAFPSFGLPPTPEQCDMKDRKSVV